MDQAMDNPFLDFLVCQGAVPAERAAGLGRHLRTAREPIGTIAFSYGMLAGGDIDEILDEQRNRHRPFGEIAIEKGLLTSEQVRKLLCLQELRAATETAEALALSDVCPMEDAIEYLGRFLTGARQHLPCTV